MQLAYHEDHRLLSDTLERFVAREYPFEVRNAVANSAIGHSPELWQQLAGIGIIGALFDASAGGFGGTGVDISLVFEGLGRGIVPEPFVAVLLGGSCLAAGSTEQRALLEQVIAGERLVTLAHSETDSGYAANVVATTAVRDGDAWVIDGSKIAVPFGAAADDIVVSARTAGNTDDDHGISLFVVPGDCDGLARHGYNNVDGGVAADIEFSSLRVAGNALLGEQGHGYTILNGAIDRGVLALSSEALGAMAVTADMTLEYLRNRKQFGVPIGNFQALQHRMADVVIAIEQARSAVVNAASALDAGGLAAARTLSAAKYTTGRTGRHVAEEAVQLHGGNGMAWEVPVAHYAKRLVMIDHQLGDEDYHLQRYVALGNGQG